MRHYVDVTDADFARAVQAGPDKAKQNTKQYVARNEPQADMDAHRETLVLLRSASPGGSLRNSSAEGVRFELTVEQAPRRFSRPVP